MLLLSIGVIASIFANGQGSPSAAYFEFSVSSHPETFVFKLTDPARIEEAREILQTGNQKIIAGIIIKQPVYYNPQWSFHFDPETIGFTEANIEVCDSTIQGIEDNLDAAYPGWCPWASHLLREIPPPTPPGTENIEPTVSMTFPFSDFSFSTSAPADLVLRANADDPDGTISKVEFFNGGMKIGETNESPYQSDWINLGPGTYTVWAVATDDLGAERVSHTVRFTVSQSSSGNAIDDTPLFVSQHYRDFFSREPDPDGQEFWENNITSCGGDESCREVKRIDTSAAFFLSIEFQETGYFVHRFYRASFARRPLFTEFLSDNQTIGQGVVVNAEGWQELLERNKRAFVDAWVNRADFEADFDGLTNQQYVDRLIENTQTLFSDTDREALIDVLDNQTLTRGQVLRAIVENSVFYDKEYNGAFVEMQYFGYLRRDPDEGGYQFWLHKLEEFDGDYRRADMVKSFLVSGEYRQRFGP
ncbi:MAG TPA: DUF4214 domain-containing protein [Pyrinomonadaceae bacterium]|nr:DUF4214 domain-containing protein [Pyrinomonadaceae bacterium]